MLEKQTSQTSDSGVSPVVGVILMVAVTVILAAVIGTFVLDLGSNTQQNPQAGVTFDQDTASSSVTVRVVSITAADTINITSEGGSFNSSECDGTVTGGGDGCELTSVGQTATANSTSNGDVVQAIGTLEGKQSVLQTYTYRT